MQKQQEQQPQQQKPLAKQKEYYIYYDTVISNSNTDTFDSAHIKFKYTLDSNIFLRLILLQDFWPAPVVQMDRVWIFAGTTI